METEFDLAKKVEAEKEDEHFHHQKDEIQVDEKKSNVLEKLLKQFYRKQTALAVSISEPEVQLQVLPDKKYEDILVESFDKVSPLIYLSSEQRKAFKNGVKYLKFPQKTTLYSGDKTNPISADWAAFILLEGEAHVLDNSRNFLDLINKIHFFGHDGPIFNKRFSQIILEKDAVVAMIPENVFLDNLQPFSKFCTFISRTIIHKEKVLDDLNTLKSFILSSTDAGYIDMEKLIHLYKNTNPCLHPKLHSDEMDLGAWTYALNRLPVSILETYVLVMLNKPPRIFYSGSADEIIPRVSSRARMRDVFRYLEGKNVIIVREMETDVLDFVSNMCIHVIEASKLRKALNSPIIIEKLFASKGSFSNAIEVFKSAVGMDLKPFEEETLKKIFGDQLGEKLIGTCLHYQDYSIQIRKMATTDLDPVENWIQNLWNVAKDLLGVNSSVDEISDLVVDIFQGSKRTLLGCISPHLHSHKEEILKWGVENNIKLKTKVFLNETDRLLAYSYYYYKAFPNMQKEKEEVERAHGIMVIEQTFSTGVQVLLVNTNLLDPLAVDPKIKLQPASKHHILLHIGYTFGAQSSYIIKPILMLFGSKARSMNIIGKAGGLTGNRTDILVASKMFYDKTNELANINYGDIDANELYEETHSPFHFGPMLTVAGTILQNNDLLYFYKRVMGCVGLEMEGYFFVREIENSIKHGLLSPSFVTRCFYYASDLPLDPSQTLSQEEGNVSWDEGIGSMNAIQRFILKQTISAK